MFLISGNPGAVDFYAEYLLRLAEQAHDRFAFYAMGHASHTAHTVHGEHVTLGEQVDIKKAFLKDLRKQHPDAKLILAGHSVGAYMCCEILRGKRLVEQQLTSLPRVILSHVPTPVPRLSPLS